MKISTTAAKTGKNRVRLWAVIFWLFAWQGVAMAIGAEILLVSPLQVLLRTVGLGQQGAFWQAVGFSCGRIISGFVLAVIIGTLAAALAARWRWFGELVTPAVAVIKATPVASFIILVLIWVSSRNLSVVISFLMVFPVMYTNVLEGISSTDSKLLEMAQIFRISPLRTVRYIYVSQVLPFFYSACSVSLGLCWKSGVAAEVIGIPDGSVGEKLYKAKIYLETADLFAWTLVIIVISLIFERLFLALIGRAVTQLERM